MIFNELGDSGNLNQVLQRRLNMLGSSPAPALMPEISSTLVLETDRPEWGFYKREVLWSASVYVAGGGAGTFSSVLLTLPANTLCVVQEVSQQLLVADVEVGWCDATPAYTLPAIGNCYSRDSGNLLTPLTIISGTTLALPPFSNANDAVLARGTTTQLPIEGPWVVRGNNSRRLLVRGVAANQGLRLTLKGYFRALLPNELV